MLYLCFLHDQLSVTFVSDFMVLKGLKLGPSTIKPLRLFSACLYPPLFECGILCLLSTAVQIWCIRDLMFICKITELFSSAWYILTILHPCMDAQARHIGTTKRMKHIIDTTNWGHRWCLHIISQVSRLQMLLQRWNVVTRTSPV
jgi:hypothetical protein